MAAHSTACPDQCGYGGIVSVHTAGGDGPIRYHRVSLRGGGMRLSMETIAVIGGTGNIGYGLALRWAEKGHRVLIGSRAAERAESAANELRAKLAEGRGAGEITGLVNPEAAAEAEIVAVTVPFAAQRPTLESIREACQGKIVIDVTVPSSRPG